MLPERVHWTRIGVAFPHKDGTGFNINLRAMPLDGKLVMLPPNQEEAEEKASAPAPAARARR